MYGPDNGNDSEHIPLAGALVITWNRREDVLDCVGALLKSTYPRLAVYVVDNASTDGSHEAIAGRYPKVRLIRSETNLGFTGGNNLGLERMMEDGVDAVFLVNDDAMVAEDAIELLMASFGNPNIGVLAPKVLVHARPEVIWAAGGLIEPESGVAVQRHYSEEDKGQADEPIDIDYAIGCSMLVKAEVIRQVGLMDARYFMYYEEADWCRRIREAGYRIVYLPESRVWHKVTLHRNGRNNAPYYFARNRLLYLNGSGMRPGRIAWIAVSDILRSAAVHAIKGHEHQGRLMAKGVADYYTGNFGKLEDGR